MERLKPARCGGAHRERSGWPDPSGLIVSAAVAGALLVDPAGGGGVAGEVDRPLCSSPGPTAGILGSSEPGGAGERRSIRMPCCHGRACLGAALGFAKALCE